MLVMNPKQHFVFSSLFMIGYWLFSLQSVDVWSIIKSLCFWWLFSCAADDDKKFDLPHRNWFFHSVAIPVAIILALFPLDPSVILLIYGSHLLLDIPQRMGKKPIGTYLIHLWKGKTLSKNRTRLWLFGNFCACVTLFFVLEAF